MAAWQCLHDQHATCLAPHDAADFLSACQDIAASFRLATLAASWCAKPSLQNLMLLNVYPCRRERLIAFGVLTHVRLQR